VNADLAEFSSYTLILCIVVGLSFVPGVSTYLHAWYERYICTGTIQGDHAHLRVDHFDDP
jgi:hypothetical protein